MTWQLSLIIPVLNEATGIVPALQALQALHSDVRSFERGERERHTKETERGRQRRRD
jgi:hypothetical protein